MAPGKRITKAAGIGGVGLALVIAAVWALTLANLRRLGVGDGADDGMILAFGQRELVSLFALLAALTLLAAFDGDMPRPAKLAALVLLPLAFAACWRSLAPLGDTPMEPWRWAIWAPAIAPPLIVAYALTTLIEPLRRALPSRPAAILAWGGVALVCCAVIVLHLMHEASMRREAVQEERWQATFDATPASAPLARWTPLLETASAARRDAVYAAMSKVATRQSDAEALLDSDAFPIGALPRIGLDPTPSLCQKARDSLIRGAARVLPQTPGVRAFREIAGEVDDAVDAMEWLVGKGCSCDDAARSWEAVARGYLNPNFDVARLRDLRNPKVLSRQNEDSAPNFSMLTLNSPLLAWLRFADDRKYGVAALIGARAIDHRTGDAIEALNSEFEAEGASRVLRFLPMLDLDPTPALCRAGLAEVRRELDAAFRPPASEARPFARLLIDTARGEPFAALQWLASHGCPADAELADAQSLVAAYEDSPSRAAMLASLAALRRKP